VIFIIKIIFKQDDGYQKNNERSELRASEASTNNARAKRAAAFMRKGRAEALPRMQLWSYALNA